MSVRWMVAALISTTMINLSWAQEQTQEQDVLQQEEAAAKEIKDRPEWTAQIKKQYSLSDEQIKTMKDQGLTHPQMAMAAGIAQKSGKPLDEVLKLRADGTKGWGQIAKELGVQPGEIGKSVAEIRHQIRDARKDRRSGRRENRSERRIERKERQLERREKRAEMKAKRREAREQRKAQ